MSAEESRLEGARLALRTAQEALGVIVVADGPVDAGGEPVFDQAGVMDEEAWRTARPDLVTQAAVQRAAERVLRDSWRDLVPNVSASFDPVYLTPADTSWGSTRSTIVRSRSRARRVLDSGLMPDGAASRGDRTGLLLINLGTPNSPRPEDVRRYLDELLEWRGLPRGQLWHLTKD